MRPSGDQPRAIRALVDGINDKQLHQTLLGVTGSGKTYTMANIIEQTNINFKKLKNYEVDISVELDIPGIRMPKSEYKVSFKQPNQIDIVSEDFGILRKAGLFESPEEEIDKLEEMVRDKMVNAMPLIVPLVVDCGRGISWFDAH